jgi:hypothetical protein
MLQVKGLTCHHRGSKARTSPPPAAAQGRARPHHIPVATRTTHHDQTDFPTDSAKWRARARQRPGPDTGEVLMLAYKNQSLVGPDPGHRRGALLVAQPPGAVAQGRHQRPCPRWRRPSASTATTTPCVLLIEQVAGGVHKGYRSCFYRELRGGDVSTLLAPGLVPKRVLQIMALPRTTATLIKFRHPQLLPAGSHHRPARPRGWKIRQHHRNYFPEVNDPSCAAPCAARRKMSRYVARRTLDLA